MTHLIHHILLFLEKLPLLIPASVRYFARKPFQDWVQDAEKYSEKVISQNKLTKANSYNTTKTLKQLESNDKIQYFLSGAISRPECCPSIYSNSSGCLCLTKEQNDFISRKN